MPLIVKFTPPPVNAAAAMAVVKPLAAVAGANVLLAAALPLVPVDTGQMRDSGEVVRAGEGAAVVFTRESPEGYNIAARQHEDPDLNHPGGGQDKFLEQPAHSERAAIGGAVAGVYRAVLG